jgi:hypothetical protein
MTLRPILFAIILGLLLSSCGPSQAGRGLTAAAIETASPTASLPPATPAAEPLVAPISIPAAIDRSLPAPQVANSARQAGTEAYPQSPQAVVQSFLRGFQQDLIDEDLLIYVSTSRRGQLSTGGIAAFLNVAGPIDSFVTQAPSGVDDDGYGLTTVAANLVVAGTLQRRSFTLTRQDRAPEAHWQIDDIVTPREPVVPTSSRPDQIVATFLSTFGAEYLEESLRTRVDTAKSGWEARVLGVDDSMPTDVLLEHADIHPLGDLRRIAHVIAYWSWAGKSVSKRLFVLVEEQGRWRIARVQGGDAYYFDALGTVPPAAIKTIDLAIGLQAGDERAARTALHRDTAANLQGTVLEWLGLPEIPQWVTVRTTSVYGYETYVDAEFVFADGSRAIRHLAAAQDPQTQEYFIAAVETSLGGDKSQGVEASAGSIED